MSSKSTFSNSTSKSYAIALYELSKESSELNKVEEEMKGLKKLVNESLDFKEMIMNPAVLIEDKKNIINIIANNNNFSETLKKFLNFVMKLCVKLDMKSSCIYLQHFGMTISNHIYKRH